MSPAWLGRALYRIRAGEKKLAYNRPSFESVPETLKLSSTDFTDGAPIPRQFAGRGVGQNVSPSLSWSHVPAESVQLVLIIEDSDVPLPRPFAHLLAYGIAPQRTGFERGELSNAADYKLGRNTFGPNGYAGPRALVGHGLHHYHFQLFALSEHVEWKDCARLSDLLS